MSEPQNAEQNIGCIISQRLTAALTGHGIPYKELSEIVYSELSAIAADQKKGDWLAFPNGTTYEMIFKP